MVTVDIVSGNGSGNAGVIFGKNDDRQFHTFRVTADHSYVVDRAVGLVDGELQWEQILPYHYSDALHAERGDHIEVICENANLWIFVNNRLIEVVEDTAVESGELGLIAGNFDDEEGALWYFDNFEVYVPTENLEKEK
ncbi:MAG: hypothetical protein JXB38_01375 [Anaerolineales bacterium]|nr:hypothetical protein [Anaerolineales bacterium]